MSIETFVRTLNEHDCFRQVLFLLNKMNNEENRKGNYEFVLGKSMVELEEMKLDSRAELEEECKEFDEFEMVFVAVEGGVVG